MERLAFPADYADNGLVSGTTQHSWWLYTGNFLLHKKSEANAAGGYHLVSWLTERGDGRNAL